MSVAQLSDRDQTGSPANETRLNFVLASLAGQITGPFVLEPYPQYLADVWRRVSDSGCPHRRQRRTCQ